MFRQKVTPVSKILEGKSKKLFNLEKNLLTSGVLAKGLDIDSKAINSEISSLKLIFFFDLFGADDVKSFIIQDHQKVIANNLCK